MLTIVSLENYGTSFCISLSASLRRTLVRFVLNYTTGIFTIAEI